MLKSNEIEEFTTQKNDHLVYGLKINKITIETSIQQLRIDIILGYFA